MPATASCLEAWRAVVQGHAALTERIERSLSAAGLPPLSWFEVLSAVHSSTGSPRMSELAERLTLSRGGITKLVDRLQEAGYLERVSCSQDRRSFRAELTPAGRRMLTSMRTVYAGEVERHLGSLTAEEVRVVTAALGKVAGSTCQQAATSGR